MVSARRTGSGTEQSAAWKFTGLIKTNGNPITLSSISAVEKSPLHSDNNLLDCNVTTDGNLSVGVTVVDDPANSTTRFTVWTAYARLTVSAADSSFVI